VAGTVRAWVNGKRVAMPTVAPFEVDITKRLHAGTNTIRFEVTTTLNNKGHLGRREGTEGVHCLREPAPHSLGPVRLKPYLQAVVGVGRTR
jgi:hypothetical protein